MTMYHAEVFIDYRLNELYTYEVTSLGNGFSLTLKNTPKFSSVKKNHLFHIKLYKKLGKNLIPVPLYDIKFTGTIASINQFHDLPWAIKGVIV